MPLGDFEGVLSVQTMAPSRRAIDALIEARIQFGVSVLIPRGEGGLPRRRILIGEKALFDATATRFEMESEGLWNTRESLPWVLPTQCWSVLAEYGLIRARRLGAALIVLIDALAKQGRKGPAWADVEVASAFREVCRFWLREV